MVLLKSALLSSVFLLLAWALPNTNSVTPENGPAVFVEDVTTPELLTYFADAQDQLEKLERVEHWEEGGQRWYRVYGQTQGQTKMLEFAITELQENGAPPCACDINSKTWFFKFGRLYCGIPCSDS